MTHHAGEMLLDLTFTSKPDRLKLVREVVRAAAEMGGCSEGCAEDMVIAVNEACMNVIQHGYRGRDGEINLRVWKDSGVMVFRLRDHADPVDMSVIKPRALDELRPGGLGTHFIRTLMDETVFLPPPDGAGNLLQMTKQIS